MLKLNCRVDEMIGELQRDTITTFYGSPGVGKSTVCFQYSVSCVNKGKKVIYIDTEGGFSAERIRQIDSDVDLNKILVFSPKSFEEQQKIILNLGKEIKNDRDVGLVVVDSLVMLYRLKLGDDAQKVNSALGEQLRLLTELSRSFKIPIIVTNQMYTTFDTKEKKMVGGALVEYWSKTILLLDREVDLRKISLRKHKFKKEGEESYFEINDKGLNFF